ncbi:hypothetical protein ACFPK9_10735 [Rubritalea spongiae]|uniref:FtsK gamma domain-containing protein n=1 Tax=Rubritalea spongiae TaxID=430797 RepID=A0ABW5E1K6_9BACT
MAITLKSDYRKTLGLPGYSSHSFSAAIEVELSSADDIPAEIHRLYQTLQQNVDTQIQDPGFVPPGDYGMEPAAPTVSSTPPPQRQTQPRATNYQQSAPKPQAWKCSEKQRKLIDKLITESKFTLSAVESVAQHRFNKAPGALNKLEASGLIDLMINQPDIFTFESGLRS